MAARQSQPLYSIDEYLAIERASEDRHEYVDGCIFAMAGESGQHADISANLVAIVVSQLRTTDCRARTKDTKVRSGPAPRGPRPMKGLFSYPDLVVICGEPLYHDEHRDVILNPKVIIEVLSESTEAFDRGEKFQRYQVWNPSLTDYVLVSQSRPLVEHYARQTASTWSYQFYAGLGQSLVMESIGCELRLADIYERVVFSPEELESPDEV
jgi:Uma2 family endonuclease